MVILINNKVALNPVPNRLVLTALPARWAPTGFNWTPARQRSCHSASARRLSQLPIPSTSIPPVSVVRFTDSDLGTSTHVCHAASPLIASSIISDKFPITASGCWSCHSFTRCSIMATSFWSGCQPTANDAWSPFSKRQLVCCFSFDCTTMFPTLNWSCTGCI